MFMAIVDTFIRAKREVSHLCDRVAPKEQATEQYYDFIVIGGGTAGAVVAARLSEVPNWRVLLLEAGPDEPPGAAVPSMVGMFIGSDIDWKILTSNETNACLGQGGRCYWPRGKNLGGTSVHNGMMYLRGNPKDYNDWAALGNKGWSWNEVLPHYLCSENNAETARVGKKYHRTGGPLNIERFPWQPAITADVLYAAVERGHPITEDLNGDALTGFTVAQMASKSGVRMSSNAAFLQPVRNRPNLSVILNATVTKIHMQNQRAVGVTYFKNNAYHQVRATREIVLSGGAIGSPQLLLLSGIGPAAHLQSVNVSVVRDLPGVGENLQNHVAFSLPFTIDEPNTFDLNWATATEYIGFQRGPMASTGLSQVTGKLVSKYGSKDHPDLQFFFGGYQAACSVDGQVGALIDQGKRSISISPVVLHPKSRGSLKLASNDPSQPPFIQGRYLSNPMDQDVLIEGIEIALSLADTFALSKYNMTLNHAPLPACSQHEFPSSNYWRCAIQHATGPENHQAGSCKMGPPSDPYAVVDPELRVYGIKGLRVADTSIMPKVTSGNTAAPAMMIGERAAAFIKKDWGAKPSTCTHESNKLDNRKDHVHDLLHWGIKFVDNNHHVLWT